MYNPGSQNAEMETSIPIADGYIKGHPDALISKNGQIILIDIKTMNDRAFTLWKRKGTIKKYPQYVDQLHAYAGSLFFSPTVIKLGIVGLNKNNSEIHIDVFDYDEKRTDEIKKRTENIFALNAPPEPGERMQDWCCSYCGYSHICELAQKKKDTHVDDKIDTTDNPEIINAISQLNEAREIKKQADEQEKEAKSFLDEHVRQKGFKSLRGGDFILNLIETSASRFDSTNFKKQYPDLFKEFSKNSSSVRYDIKEV